MKTVELVIKHPSGSVITCQQEVDEEFNYKACKTAELKWLNDYGNKNMIGSAEFLDVRVAKLVYGKGLVIKSKVI